MRYQAALRPDRCRDGRCGKGALARMAAMPQAGLHGGRREPIQAPMIKALPAQAAMGQRALIFSSICHALMHMMTAFYAGIVLTLAVVWALPPEALLEPYAPSAVPL